MLDVGKIRKDFSILNKMINGKQLIYLDNGATSLTPEPVIGAMNEYYGEYNANVHRSIHSIGERATREYEKAHEKVARFINADFEEIIFTKGTTESLNTLAYCLTKRLKEGDVIILSEMEHHSNLVPWQQLAKEKKLIVKYIKINEDFELDLEHAKKIIDKKTKIVSVTHVSNVLGTINDVKKIGELAHDAGAIFIVDSAQGIPHLAIDVKKIDCDFFCFSGHKMLGPTGIGVLYGKKELLEKLDPFLFGGEMIKEVGFEDSKWNNLPWKFEAGTPNIAGGIGLGAAIDYLNKIGTEKIREYEEYLTEYGIKRLNEIGVKIYCPKNPKIRSGVISFKINGMHAHDVVALLDREGVAIRGGHMCAMPLVTKVLNENSLCRASLYFYNTPEEIDKLVGGIKKAKEVFQII
ncbi:SufS family cysteine desulfurase [Candidatus Woesearchaeota archaeon]|nr:SufS family cysteine desulfurase [Candidatus Woesearchaeota archaeon]